MQDTWLRSICCRLDIATLAWYFRKRLEMTVPENGFKGQSDALEEAGAIVPEHWRSEAPYSIAQAKRATLMLLETAPHPTALLCGNDVIAQGALYAAQKLGFAVPGEISIIGIGDFKGSEDLEPGLTTINIPAHDIGTIAGENFTRMITTNDTEIHRFKCELSCVIRNTTAPKL